MADKVIKADFSKLPKESMLIRELVDEHMYNGFPLDEVPADELLQAMYLLLLYIPILEHTLKSNDINKLELEVKE